MFGIMKKLFIVLLASIFNASNHTKYVSLSNQKCQIQVNETYILMNTIKNYPIIHLQLN